MQLLLQAAEIRFMRMIKGTRCFKMLVAEREEAEREVAERQVDVLMHREFSA